MSWFTVKTRSFTDPEEEGRRGEKKGARPRHHKIKLPDRRARVRLPAALGDAHHYISCITLLLSRSREQKKKKKNNDIHTRVSSRCRRCYFLRAVIATRRDDCCVWLSRFILRIRAITGEKVIRGRKGGWEGGRGTRRTRDEFRAMRASSIEIFVPKTSKFSKRPDQLRVAFHLRVRRYCFGSSAGLGERKKKEKKTR